MAAITDTFDLGRLQLHSGEGRRVDVDVRIDSLVLAGQTYSAEGGRVTARLDVSHMTSGYALRLRFDTKLQGPCMRCLDDADRGFSIDAREVDHPGGGDDDLRSPYLEGEELDVRAWARDALALALPTKIVCTADCRGLCAICGENLNKAGPDHHHEAAPDPRWAKLSELKLD
ncbi:MAG: YceD family protein [Thermoleophilaceae bacterium]